nr:hypothetical protein [Tanacetum cinerariifolium]
MIQAVRINVPLVDVLAGMPNSGNIDIIDEILEEDFDALLDEGSKILHFIKETILEEKLFAEFDEFMAYWRLLLRFRLRLCLLGDLELKPLPDNLEYVYLEEPSFLP